MSFFISIFAISFLIFFHELGHFVVARLFGVKVKVFSIGFGRYLFSKKINETIYAISLIPLGGYVRMKGQNDLDPKEISKDEDSYSSKHPIKKILILLAGPFANFLLAYILYIIVGLNGYQVLAPVVGKVLDNSPASIAKLKTGDKIVAINRQKITTWDEMSDIIKNSNSDILLHIIRDNTNITILITPKILESKNIFKEIEKRVMIGVSPRGDIIEKKLLFNETFGFAIDKTLEASLFIIKGVQKLLQGVIPTKEIGGIISVVDVTSKASSLGMVALLSLVALISINLGILNLLPIPALDGGHIVFNIYELIFNKKINDRLFYYFTIAGWVLILSLMFVGLNNDINRILQS